MNVENLAIPEVKLIIPRRFNDARGFFAQTYQHKQYVEGGIPSTFVQDNWSRSSKGVLRGLHYQYEHAQAKLVSVIRGAVFDVVVDMRKASPTFGKWAGVVLSEENGHQLFVPKGFAHGFLVLSEIVDFMYKCDDYYAPGDEYGVRWDDPTLGIKWPEIVSPLVSDKDATLPLFADAQYF
ncbi:MAG: dTDP-4-dehydrorhamnose 3,5-epimerase [Pontiellaceae bacterium]|nr:dTDP-4-dehydrorhamnose 3,5-epimerase [Pontiellaceae bacterium]